NKKVLALVSGFEWKGKYLNVDRLLGAVAQPFARSKSMAVRVDLNISLDGFATTTDQPPDKPFVEDWSRLVGAYVKTRTFRERVLHDKSGQGTSGVDDEYAKAYFVDIGAEI